MERIRSRRISNKNKSEQLGMPFGTACHQLRMRVLFYLLKKHSENVCFQCGKKIRTVEELSIEHKKPWLYHPEHDNRRFWHMSNIAFSHRKCNTQHVHGARHKRKIGPDGTAWCTSCKKFLNTDSFHKDKNHWNGYHKRCKQCFYAYRKQWRKKIRSRSSIE